MNAVPPPYGMMAPVGYIPIKTNAQVISEQLDQMKQNWKANLESIRTIKGSIRFELIIYFFVVMVMLFFIAVILLDLYNTFRFHSVMSQDARHQSYWNNKRNALDDDNEYGDGGGVNFVNTNEYIMSGLEQRDRNVNRHFESLLAFKKRHNIETDLNVDIDAKVLGRENDNYSYPSTKKNTPFTELLFAEPNYSFVNRAGGSLA